MDSPRRHTTGGAGPASRPFVRLGQHLQRCRAVQGADHRNPPALTTWWGYFGYSAAEGTGDSFDDTRFGRQFYGRLFRICTGQTQGTDCPPPPAGNLSVRQDLRFWYDNVGNVLNLRDYANTNQVQTFTYDGLDRLTRGYSDAVGQGVYDETYAYSGNDGKIGNLTSKTGVGSYTYGAPVSGCSAGTPTYKPHAVRTAGSYTFSYDCNGNLTTRNVGTSYSLTYDAENRLTGVSGGASASFVYDGDGQRVKATVNGVTTVYVGGYYEQTGSTIKKYYSAGGQRVAMRENSTLYYLLTDHLGSTAVTATSAGSKQAELRYKAWGETRYTSGTTPTTYRFTGQREESTPELCFLCFMYCVDAAEFYAYNTTVHRL